MGRNAEITRNFYEAYNLRDWDALAALMSPRIEWFHAARGELIRGVEAVTALFRSSAEAFPEAHVSVSAVHESAETVIAEWSYISARSRSRLRKALACDVTQIRDGKVVRGATYGDTLQMLLEMDLPGGARPQEPEEEEKRSIIPVAPAAPVIRFRAA
jgi:ketosteroid isomerase-like protein